MTCRECLHNPHYYAFFLHLTYEQKTQKYLFDHYLHFLKLHIINNYINSLFMSKTFLWT